MVIDYDRAAADYEASLITKLRGHGAGSFLENWVPDPDPALGLVNMIEAAWTGGESTLHVTISRATLDGGGLERLKRLAESIAELAITADTAHYHLEARRAARVGGARRAAPVTRASRPVAGSIRKGQERPAIPGIQPMLAEALQAETARFTHEETHAAADGNVTLSIDKDGLIRAARHSGVQPDVRRRLVELMCREIEGRTLQDASDHAAVLAIHRLQARAGARPTAGILLPANAGSEVPGALELVRRACRACHKRAGKEDEPNFFEVAPGSEWQALSGGERLRRVVAATDEFCTAEGAAGAARAVRVDKDIHGHEIRVIVQVDGARLAEGVPFFLRRLERFVKGRVERRLELYLEPLKDKNVLRRL
jgi:hypothetical protein